MIVRWVAAALCPLLLLTGCGQRADDSAEAGSSATAAPTNAASSDPPAGLLLAETPFGRLQVPRDGDEAVVMLRQMPGDVAGWPLGTRSPGRAVYDHPAGELGIEAGEIEDIYGRPISAARAVQLFGRDLDGQRAEPCASAPGRCVLGSLDGQEAVVWSHDDSEVLMVAVWPAPEARDQLLRTWVDQQGGGQR